MDSFWKTAVFSGWIWPDWRNTALADMAGLGSKGIRSILARLLWTVR